MHKLALSSLAALLLAATAYAQNLSGPDPRLTPGAVGSRDVAIVCARDDQGHHIYSREHRVWRDKRDTLAKYGIPQNQRSLYEDDDRIPLCLGGDNADPRNHWPQPWNEAEVKDRLEREICKAVCDRHTMTLDQGQRIFFGDSWYRQLSGEP